ncbi:FAD-dependent oxidoreductase [Croceicoccus sp. F390]|uniref:FAD-dependent oxidoreductase n=1 Tax=Croceicoccus esteveae TaxID=3075597 RepID=A0ABU2ZIW1_9SPHN|nr:FAD-dependent oxidoreductase [Croceicoccus sp. F390]MDT0575342.1 FAD-dependent oxidoreductase [Croceicoccus sp. F390]
MKASLHHPLQAADVIQWDHHCDVAVVGFGAAGACAALEAARAGASVTLFEMAGGSGGASALSGGEIYIGGGSDAQTAAGFSDSAEALETYLQMAGGPDADADKCALYARNSLDHYQWLKDQGVPYKGTYVPGKVIEPTTDDTLIWSGSELAWPFREQAAPAPRGHVIQHEGWGGGRKLVDILEARTVEAGVDVQCNARVTALIMDGRAVAGLVVRQDGQERCIRATRGVILCTGGFCMNEDMLRRYAPHAAKLNDPIGVNDNGSGIEMGMAAGGDAIHLDEFFSTCPWIMPDSLAQGVFVNVAGNRFIGEDAYHGRVSRTMLDQPGGHVYLLVDNATFAQPLDIARIEIAAVGESWEEVEAELGMEPETLSATMRVYNRNAAQGRDPLFHRGPEFMTPLVEAPFAALKLDFSTSYFSFFTLGGLNTAPTGEVLDRGGIPVPGLYAAGRASCGLPRWGHGYSSGMSLADCTFFGRQAGLSAARNEPADAVSNRSIDVVSAE